jgi:hypothetical protein
VVYDVKAAALSKLAMEGETVYRDQAMELIADMCKRWGKTDTRVSQTYTRLRDVGAKLI